MTSLKADPFSISVELDGLLMRMRSPWTKPPVVSGSAIVLPGAEKFRTLRQVGEQDANAPGELVTKSIATRRGEPDIAELSIERFRVPANRVEQPRARYGNSRIDPSIVCLPLSGESKSPSLHTAGR